MPIFKIKVRVIIYQILSGDKNMNDYLLKATAANGSVRAFVATTRNIVAEASKIHNTTPVVTAALGRLLTATSIMGSMLKNEEDIMTLTIRGNGPIKGVVATSDCTANVKGYVFEPFVDIPLKENGKFDVSGAIGTGTLNVIKDTGLKEPYVGQVQLVSGEIAEDLTYYFAKSEQTPSVVALGVLIDTDLSVKQAGGMIIQLLPFAEEEVICSIEEKLKNLSSITTLLEQGNTPEDILEILLGEFNVKINEVIPISYYCNCTRKRVEKALISVGELELIKIIEEDKKATLHCHFCGKDYNFEEEELKKLLEGSLQAEPLQE